MSDEYYNFFFIIKKEGDLANTFANLVKSLWLGSENYVSPWSLKKIIGRLAPQVNLFLDQNKNLFGFLIYNLQF